MCIRYPETTKEISKRNARNGYKILYVDNGLLFPPCWENDYPIALLDKKQWIEDPNQNSVIHPLVTHKKYPAGFHMFHSIKEARKALPSTSSLCKPKRPFENYRIFKVKLAGIVTTGTTPTYMFNDLCDHKESAGSLIRIVCEVK